MSEVKIIEEPKLSAEVERKLPPLIDIFLYPISASGIIHLAVFLLVPWLCSSFVGSLASLIPGRYPRFAFGYVTGFLLLVLYIFFLGYVFYYVGYCIFDSAKGGLRAPDINVQSFIPDRGDLIAQLLCVLGCAAVCFWPVAVYLIFARRTDLIFWLLAGCGFFFFPMALLAGILFDSFNALNPILIIGSIYKVFPQYCGLVLLVGGLGGFVALMLPRLQVWGFVSSAIKIYLLFVTAHLLGRFYWLNKDKLDWGL
ncbi:MAG: hypothetical protein DRP62_06555 [Planctomycetota bacterium]|nr:MAG: hypothetical protein DRP62_06555 [Planctomycetota bacterium]